MSDATAASPADRPADDPRPRVIAGADALNRFLGGLVEATFQTELGVADPSLTDYLADLLARFARIDAVFAVRNPAGERIEEVAGLLAEADAREGRPRRECFRHAGDVALFYTGVYPEHLNRRDSADALLNVSSLGKVAYRRAADVPPDADRPVLLRLADEFDLCGVGLGRVRAEWEKLAA